MGVHCGGGRYLVYIHTKFRRFSGALEGEAAVLIFKLTRFFAFAPSRVANRSPVEICMCDYAAQNESKGTPPYGSLYQWERDIERYTWNLLDGNMASWYRFSPPLQWQRFVRHPGGMCHAVRTGLFCESAKRGTVENPW